MATRLRMIFISGGAADGGGWARIRLEGIYAKLVGSFPARGSLPEAQRLTKMFKTLPESYRSVSALFLFREPRTVSLARSRWKQLSRHYGITPRRPKKLKVGVIAGAINARNIRGAAARGPRAGGLPEARGQQIRFRPPRVFANPGNRVAPRGDVPPQGGILDPEGIGGLAGLGGQAVGEAPRWNANHWFIAPNAPEQVPAPAEPAPAARNFAEEFAAQMRERLRQQQREIDAIQWQQARRDNNDGQW